MTQDLFAWTEKQADWARDALRRHACALNFELGADDKAQVLRRVRQAAGIADEGVCENVPFAAEHFKSSASAGTRTLLVSLGPVKNLARLAPDQRLSFALDGITLIYGDNGSGKTGYCRITKKACRNSRPTICSAMFSRKARNRQPRLSSAIVAMVRKT